MAFDLTGRALFPVGDLIAVADFPLAEFLPADSVDEVFEGLYYTDSTLYRDGENLVFDVRLVWDGELSISPPGTDAFAVVVGSAGAGLTTAHAEIVLGPDFSLALREVTVGIRVSPHVLRDVATGNAAEISVSGDLRVGAGGLTLGNFVGGTLAPAYLCGTEIVVAAADVRPVFGGSDPPEFLENQTDFQGVAFAKLGVTIPADHLELDPGSSLTVELTNAAIGTTGFTGAVGVMADAAHPVSGKLLGFPFRFRELRIDVDQNAILDATLACDLRVEALEDGDGEKWLGVDVAFSGDGDLTATLSAVQPPEAQGNTEAVVTAEFAGVVALDLASLRITRIDTVWSCWFSGALQLQVPGADWPKVAFDEIGVSADGRFHIADGGGITFATPMVVDWHFARLSVSKFRFGHAEGSMERLRIALGAEVVLVEGIPAGAAVEGLVIEWTPGSGAGADVRFEGIGIEFGVPGSFRAALSIAYRDEAGVVQFRGSGTIEIPALDVLLDVAVVVGREDAPPDPFVYMYLFADAKLLPAGIPVGSTGLAIYGFQGLIAYQMGMDVDPALPPDQRVYALFMKDPVGITAGTKWVPARGQNALGAGVVLGTMDKGFAINAKGMLVVAFPDIAILLHAKANFLKQRPKLNERQEGALEALMVYSAGESTLSLDIVASWEIASIVSVGGQARAFFDFTDRSAFYLEIGRDEEGKRVVAQAIKWNGEWLFSAGFWFRLDAHGLVTGLQVDIDLRKSKGGFYVEVKGSGRAEMALFWEPSQWEGSLALSGRISAGYKGISIGMRLAGEARARVKRPLEVHLHVEACIEALFWDICKSFDFDWKQVLPPVLELPFRRTGATPRHWTPVHVAGPPERVEDGIVALEASSTPMIAPHSGLAIDFAKPMVDLTGRFNEAVTLPDGGFLTVGEESGYAAAFLLDAVELVRDPDGVREAVPIWGTWARETLEPNTTLRLLSSERFGDDGSLSDGYVDGLDIDYCAEPTPTQQCVSLSSVQPGYGRLRDGSLYELVLDKGGALPAEGLILRPRDRLTIRCKVKVKVAQLEMITPDGALERLEVKADSAGIFTIWGKVVPDRRLVRFCYARGHGWLDWVVAAQLGGTLTGTEAWTVPAEMRVFRPNQAYELVLKTTPRLLAPDGTASEPLGSAVVTKRRFRTSGPPAYDGALTNYIADTYPADGKRPAYTGYDLVVRFVEGYVPYLYLSVGEALAIRLFDGLGRPVRDDDGGEVLVPIPEPGPELVSSTLWAWGQIIEANVANGCVDRLPPPVPADTVRRLVDVELTPNSQYTAVLVSDARPHQALARWGFTTSRFATFTDLVTRDREIAPPRTAAGAIAGADFEACVRAIGVPTVAYVDRFTVTPILDPGGTEPVALLLEAPEPFEHGTRLRITVDGAATTALANVDGTRLLVTPAGGAFTPGPLDVRLRWRRDAGAALPVLAVAGNSSDEVVDLVVEGGA
ncbi:hypothetical protein [Asanoa iriomotensis]|uniref:Uncharacterized protein n=1 Tax=Asanoa iriomotensis TaxID=234613 RepID=A0ABQ4BZ55_9ACTN|nr:hypothetical protein [Asanoa iriomotensis]GIF55785.1 hypothetical protein Air01nite_18800 [Asanoa iriomotensis]